MTPHGVPSSTARNLASSDPSDVVGGIVAAVAVDGGGWLLGKARDLLSARITGRGAASEPASLPVAERTDTPTGNVRLRP